MAYTQYFEQENQPKKGWTALTALDISRPFDSSVTGQVPAGRCVSLNASGNFVLGLSGNRAMPLFTLRASDDLDVVNESTGVTPWKSPQPGGNVAALVATGGYELETTEFDTAQTYAPNDTLTADAAGRLTNLGAVPYTNPVVGVCSWHTTGKAGYNATAPTGTNAHGVATLSFWPVYLPIP